MRLKKDEAEAALIEAKTPKDQPDPDVVAFKAFVMSGFRATKVQTVPAGDKRVDRVRVSSKTGTSWWGDYNQWGTPMYASMRRGDKQIGIALSFTTLLPARASFFEQYHYHNF